MGLIWVKRLLSKAQQSSGVKGIWQGGVLLSPTVSDLALGEKDEPRFDWTTTDTFILSNFFMVLYSSR